MTANKLTLQVRRPSRDYSDPGQVEVGYWIVSGDRVFLTDEHGVKTDHSRRLTEGADAKNVATALLRGRIGVRKSDFNRPLRYPTLRY
jgi:hypothetical protein